MKISYPGAHGHRGEKKNYISFRVSTNHLILEANVGVGMHMHTFLCAHTYYVHTLNMQDE